MPVTHKTSRTLSPPPSSASELPLSPPALNISPPVKPPRYLADSMMHFINAGLAQWDTTPELTDDVWKIVKAFRCSLKYGEGMYKTPVLGDNYRYELDFFQAGKRATRQIQDQIWLRALDEVTAINSIIADLRGLPRRPGRVLRRNLPARGTNPDSVLKVSSSS